MNELFDVTQRQSLLFTVRFQINSAVFVNLRRWKVLEGQPKNEMLTTSTFYSSTEKMYVPKLWVRHLGLISCS